ncbi:MAG: FKBP-type peptidyl-prolyl cis-trans isomerase [Nitrospirales bacterium]
MKIKSGIKLIEEQEGTGLAAQNGDQCVYHWKVFLNRGDEIPFDAINIRQFDEGLHPYRPRPITRSIGADTVIERKTTLGRRETLPFIHSTLRGMKGGGYRKVRVSPHLGYGEAGLPEYGIPPGAVLIVELWLTAVQPKSIHRSKDPYFGFAPHFFSAVMDACSQELQNIGLHARNSTTLSMQLSEEFSGWIYLKPSIREQRDLLHVTPMIGVWFVPHLQIWKKIMENESNRSPICGWLGHLMPDEEQKYFAFSVDTPIELTAQELATAVKLYGFPFMKDFALPEPYLEHIRLNGSIIYNAPMLATLYYVLKDKGQMLLVIENQEREGKEKNRQDGGYKEFLRFSKRFWDYVDTHPIPPS